MAFTQEQQVALALLPKITGGLSVLFSFLIALLILRDDSRRRLCYHRLLCGISVVDMSASLWMFCSTWPIPAESNVTWAAGNGVSCQFQGFFLQFGVSSPFYNASLSIYYWLVIVRQWKEEEIRRIEWLLHAGPLGWAAASALTGLVLDVYANANLWCWVGAEHKLFRWTAYYGPLWCMIVVATACCLSIYWHVRQFAVTAHVQQQRKLAATMEATIERSGQFGTTRATADPAEEERIRRRDNGEVEDDDEYEVSQEFLSSCEMNVDQRPRRLSHQSTNHHERDNEDTMASSSAAQVRRIVMPATFAKNLRHSRAIHRQSQRMREIAHQCFWYAAAFYVNFAALTCIRLLQTIDPNRPLPFFLVLAAAITVPMQGLPNFIIYLRPRLKKRLTHVFRRYCPRHCCCCLPNVFVDNRPDAPWWYRLAQSLSDRNRRHGPSSGDVNTPAAAAAAATSMERDHRLTMSSAAIVNVNPTVLNDMPCDHLPDKVSKATIRMDRAKGRAGAQGQRRQKQADVDDDEETETVLVVVETEQGRRWRIEYNDKPSRQRMMAGNEEEAWATGPSNSDSTDDVVEGSNSVYRHGNFPRTMIDLGNVQEEDSDRGVEEYDGYEEGRGRRRSATSEKQTEEPSVHVMEEASQDGSCPFWKKPIETEAMPPSG